MSFSDSDDDSSAPPSVRENQCIFCGREGSDIVWYSRCDQCWAEAREMNWNYTDFQPVTDDTDDGESMVTVNLDDCEHGDCDGDPGDPAHEDHGYHADDGDGDYGHGRDCENEDCETPPPPSVPPPELTSPSTLDVILAMALRSSLRL